MKYDLVRSVLQDLVVAFVLLTRLPMPRVTPAAFDQGARAVWAYPVVGCVVGGLACAAGLAASVAGLPPVLAAAAALAVMMLGTGAMHEDGLADMADGVWGGTDREKRLAIMKDSQIGSYGTLSLLLVTGARWGAIAYLLPTMPAAIVASAALSRAAIPALMAYLPSARAQGLSHSVGRPGAKAVVAGAAIAVSGAASVIGFAVIPACLVIVLVCALVGGLARARLGGQTGDVLGATQQLTELGALVVCVALVA